MGRRGILALFAFMCIIWVIGIHATISYLGYDPLATGLINGPYVSIDSWSLVHVLIFALNGFFCPDMPWLFMGLGIFWELLEFALSQDTSFWAERGVNSVWDIWFNLVGYRLGEAILVIFG